jgi:hypothetical protein
MCSVYRDEALERAEKMKMERNENLRACLHTHFPAPALRTKVVIAVNEVRSRNRETPKSRHSFNV